MQHKFNISPERLNKMVKDWDRTKLDGAGSQKSLRKKKAKDSGTVDTDVHSERTVYFNRAESNTEDALSLCG